MKKKEISLICLFFLLITVVFFYKVFFHGFIPFPGDLLIAEYSPWKVLPLMGYAAGGFPDKGQYFDVLRQMYPWKTLVLALFSHGQWPLWNPYNFSGAPLLANFQSAALYPLNIIYLFVSQIAGWTILVFLQPFLLGFFTYLFARKISLSWVASLLAGISFSFCSYVIVWLEYNTVLQVILWMPLALLAIEHILSERKVVWMIILTLSLFASATAGHPQIFFYVFTFCLVYSLYRIITFQQSIAKKKSFWLVVILFSLSLGISAIQLLPGMELILYAARASHTYTQLITKLLIQPQQLIMFFIPDFFGNPATRNYLIQDTYVGKMISIGIIPLLFVSVSLQKWKEALVRFFLIISILLLTLATNNPLAHLIYALPIGALTASGPTLIMFLFCFSLSILAGYGVDVYQKKNISLWSFFIWNIPLIFIITILWLLIGFGKHIGLFADQNAVHIAMRNSIVPTILLGISLFALVVGKRQQKLGQAVLIGLVLLQLIDSWRAFQKFNPFVPAQAVFPTVPIITTLQQKNMTQSRVWGIDDANSLPNVQTQYHLYSPEGYDPLYPKWYGEFIQVANTGKIVTQFTDATRSDASILSGSVSDFATNANKQKILNLLGVKYILSRTAIPDEQLLFSDNGISIYENNNALPRTFVTTSYETYASPKSFAQKFFTQKNQKTILLSKPIQKNLTATLTSVKITAYTPNSVSLTTQTNGSALLFLSDTYYPGWKAFINGRETPILMADYAFRAIEIPSGESIVRFSYQPLSFILGATISLISCILIGGVLVSIKKYRWL